MDGAPTLRLARTLAASGIAAVVAAMAMIATLHVVPPSADLDPMRRTISQYALLVESALVFNVAVLALAAGSVATMCALISAGIVPVRSGAALALLLWSVGLAAVVYFPKHNWAVGPSMDGTIHRFASVLAFLSLPVAALLVGRPWRGHDRWAGSPRRRWCSGCWRCCASRRSRWRWPSSRSPGCAGGGRSRWAGWSARSR